MLDWQHTYRLSRFALLRIGDSGFVIESSLTNQVLPIVGPSVMRVLAVLGRPIRLEALIMLVEESQRAPLRVFLEACYEARLLTQVKDDGTTEEETSSLAHWEFHDLLFHASGRLGRNRQAIGATYRLKNRVLPEAALRPVRDGRIIALPRPCQQGKKNNFLSGAVDHRRSRCGLRSLNLDCLSELLYCSCRTTKIIDDSDDTATQTIYPSGEGVHPLNVYVAISLCNGCVPGLYAYQDVDHNLRQIRGLDSTVQRLLSDARDSMGGLSGNPSVLLIVSARFRRTALKYESIAYRLILLEVGALFQTIHLAATDIGIVACALGSGDSDHFARAIGSDYYAETSVGEVALGMDPPPTNPIS
jgi:oxazoline/thiazoline dehydrogenase